MPRTGSKMLMYVHNGRQIALPEREIVLTPHEHKAKNYRQAQ
jgi:hypothetical protein